MENRQATATLVSSKPAVPVASMEAFEKTFNPGTLQGSGTFGQVFRGFCAKTKRRYAIKVFRVGLDEQFAVHTRPLSQQRPRWSQNRLLKEEGKPMAMEEGQEKREGVPAGEQVKERGGENYERDLRSAFREAAIVRSLDHPSLMRFTGLYLLENGWLTLVSEYAGSRSLRNADIRDGNVFWRLWIDLSSALAWLHEHGIVHRDVKPSNVVITRNDRAVLIDFGLATVAYPNLFGYRDISPSRLLEPTKSKRLLSCSTAAGSDPGILPHIPNRITLLPENRVCGSCSFLSPQALGAKSPREFDLAKNDVYGLGVTLYHILPPYGYPYIEDPDFMKSKVTHEVVEAYRQRLLTGNYHRLPILCDVGNQLLHQMVDRDETTRPTAAQVCDRVTQHAQKHHPKAIDMDP
jgi:serine/threonine protein kinase